jgi:hypothetical protein
MQSPPGSRALLIWSKVQKSPFYPSVRPFGPNRTRLRHPKAENILVMGAGTTSTGEAATTNSPRTLVTNPDRKEGGSAL